MSVRAARRRLEKLVAKAVRTRDAWFARSLREEEDLNDDCEYKPTGTARYGNHYWCVKVPKSVCPRGEIYACADKAEVTGGGDLVLWQDGKDGRSPNLAFARGQWHVFYAASFIDGLAVAVEHWEGEVAR